MKRNRQSRRRGALLIIVLSILVLFALIALTFVVVAGSFNRAAKTAVRVNITDDEGRQLVERAFLELVRGSNNAGSVESLLEDLYGGGLAGTQTTSADPNGGLAFMNATGLPQQRNALAGRVLTPIEGPQSGLSSRIAFSGNIPPANSSFGLLLEPFVNDAGLSVTGAGTFPRSFIINGRPYSGAAGANSNEPWDAPDQYNPFLAFIPADAPTTAIVPSFADRLLPLLDYNGDGTPDPVSIDNDRDGIPDSGWIDVSLPIKAAPDGRRYKPLVAFLCIDLDGRLNLNAHGNKAQVGSNNANYAANHPGPLAGDATANGPRGFGFGPADVNLTGVFNSDAKVTALIEGRYASASGDVDPSRGGVEDLWRLSGQGVPNNYASAPQGYASPPDILGGGMVGVDHGGRPSYFNAGIANEFDLSPYQINLVQPNGKDKPYTTGELETLLRFGDLDRSALPRLWDRASGLAESDFSSPAVRRSITVASSYVPTVMGSADIRGELAARIGGTITEVNQQDVLISRLLPFELLQGRRFNVNRPWGNGVDNNSNSVVDDLGELTASETIFNGVTAYGTAPNAAYVNGVLLGGTPPETTPDLSKGRYLYARQLYTLMLLASDANYAMSTSEGLDATKARELTVRRIAQWAINVVDARDPDAIMTAFEYDMNPFNGWDVDGDITTDDGGHADRRVVWGMEYPDLRFTESWATHDKRLRDTDWDNRSDINNETQNVDNVAYASRPGMKRLHPDWSATDATEDPPVEHRGDKDLDQYRVPQGTVYFELYATRALASQNPVFPRELYNASGELELTRRDNNNNGNNPVWRIAISEPQSGNNVNSTKNANSPAVLRTTRPESSTFHPPYMSTFSSDYSSNNPEYATVAEERNTANNLAIERYVWFSTAAPATAGDEYRTFRHRAGATTVAPGEYLVIGPRKKTIFGSRPSGNDNAKDLAAPARDPGTPTLNGTQMIHFQGSGTGITFTNAAGAAATYPKPVKWFVAGADAPTTWTNAGTTAPTGIGVNVSEPLPNNNYYDEPTTSLHSGTDIPTDAYGDGADANATFPDEPFDSVAGRPLKDLGLLETGKTENFRSAFLQRLANPLLPYDVVSNPYITVDWIPIDLSVYNGEDLSSAEAKDEYSVADAAAGTEHPGWFGPFDPDDGGAGNVGFGTRQAAGASQNLWSAITQAQVQDVAGDVDVKTAYMQHSLNGTPGYLNASFGAPIASGNGAGDPQNGPFPWLFWPNRPYFSHYELMLVPASSASRLTSEAANFNPGANLYTSERGKFGHLLNFHHSSGAANQVGHFYRVLEYLSVPSPFAGADTWLSPTLSGMPATLRDNNAYHYSPPFNRMSRFRDPGRININTMPGPMVWQAIDNNGNSGTGFATWAEIDASRRGTVDAYGRFTGAFRSIAGSGASTGDSLLRPSPASQSAGTPVPLLGPPTTTASYNNPSQHAYFQLQGLHRLGNVVGVQSNVFAIWITIGYFEVDAAGTPIRELGQDTGETVRHRGFYIYDRSIPVAFEKGKDHNVIKGVRLRRYIE